MKDKYYVKLLEETLVDNNLAIFCENCGEFVFQNELSEGQTECDRCLEKSEQMENWRKDCGV